MSETSTKGQDVALPAAGNVPSFPDAPGMSMLNVIAAAAANPATDVTKLEALLRMQREVTADQAKVAFTRALHRLKADLPAISKEGVIDLGPDKNGKPRQVAFAKWEDMAKVIEPLLTREGFIISFTSRERQKEGGGAIVIGTLEHVDGHSREAEFSLPLDAGPGRNNLQAAGSTLSYGKRYVVEMLLNIVRKGEDDDGKLGGTRFITPEQKAELIALLKETGVDTVSFLRSLGDMQSLDEIEAAAFIPGRNNLLQKKAAQARRAAGQQ